MNVQIWNGLICRDNQKEVISIPAVDRTHLAEFHQIEGSYFSELLYKSFNI